MDINQYLKYNNLKINLLELQNSVSGWSISKQRYKTEKIIKITPIKTNTYYIINGIKFHNLSELLIRDEDSIKSIFMNELYDRFLQNEEINILNYKLENVKINTFEFIERASVRNYCTFLNLSLSENMLYVPYSEYSILIKGVLFV